MTARSSAPRVARRLKAVALALTLLLPATSALADAQFQRWVADFRGGAASNGVSNSTFDRAFRNVTAPDPEVLEKARYQPEFVAPVWD